MLSFAGPVAALGLWAPSLLGSTLLIVGLLAVLVFLLLARTLLFVLIVGVLLLLVGAVALGGFIPGL